VVVVMVVMVVMVMVWVGHLIETTAGKTGATATCPRLFFP
jgi:hypothetical protein